MKSLWVKNIGEHRDRWDAGFRFPLLRFQPDVTFGGFDAPACFHFFAKPGMILHAGWPDIECISKNRSIY